MQMKVLYLLQLHRRDAVAFWHLCT